MILYKRNNILSALTSLLWIVSCSSNYGTDHPTEPLKREVSPPRADIKFKNMLGINGFEWEFLRNGEMVSEQTDLIKPFGEFRHYLDWHRIESKEGEYAFNPNLNGNWYYDEIYAWCYENDITVLTCLKTVPEWFQKSYYPSGQRDNENVPAAYDADKSDPSSYVKFAKLGFQFAARYGSNKLVDPLLVSVIAEPSWDPNKKKIGLGLIKYIECNNEPDRWWKGEKAQQSAQEYAANLSAFYDGHMGTLGPDVGVKTADPNMTVVMGGLANPDPKFVIEMVEWCRDNRGYNEDGSINLCFDVVNYHFYSNNKQSDWSAPGIRGEAPEISDAPDIARSFVQMSSQYLDEMEIWVTELGYDVNPRSPQRAISIDKSGKSILETQADWVLRSSFMYARNGISKIHFYMLNDVDTESSTQYSSSGFIDENGRRPALDYVLQARNLLGEFNYTKTLNTNPFVDLYTDGDKKIYVLMVPDEVGREEVYSLDTEESTRVKVHHLQIGTEDMKTEIIDTVNGKLTLTVTETPVFVELL